MAEETVKTSGAEDLAGFQTVVQQQEGIFGPLKALGKDSGGMNTITLEIAGSPANRAELAEFSGATPPAKEGYVVVTTGDCYVAGEAKKVVAYRKR